jgi:hypothetical protein
VVLDVDDQIRPGVQQRVGDELTGQQLGGVADVDLTAGRQGATDQPAGEPRAGG